MGFDYALVHVKYTIPPAVLLTVLYRPLLTKLDIYKLVFLVLTAVVSTIPWDSYLIRTHIWSYPPHVIIGPTLFDIPLEEVFFFVIQTYNTSLLYLILSRPTFQPTYLQTESSQHGPRNSSQYKWQLYKGIGQAILACVIAYGFMLVKEGREGTYSGLIIIWAVPVILLLWTIACQFIICLPLSNTLVPIAIPTLYLWIVDTLSLNRGTWVINHGTKFGSHLWDGLDIEEAFFFLVTNTLIVFGQIAFDNALCVLYTFPHLFPDPSPLPSPATLMRAITTPASKYDEDRIIGLQEAVARLKKKSRSFYLASSTFQGQLRMDLLLLYSFCRVADDLVDDSSSDKEAEQWIGKLSKFLDLVYGTAQEGIPVVDYVRHNFPRDTQSALLQLPASKISRPALDELLRGFEMDLSFAKPGVEPINDENDLELYAHRVAGTVAQMCIELIFHTYDRSAKDSHKDRIVHAGNLAGIALQYVNIARDIAVDTKMDRVYLPSTWLKSFGLSHDSIIQDPQGPTVEKLRSHLLDKAFALYEDSRNAIEELPIEARGPIRVAVESYMEIGRVLRGKGYVVKAGRATVPKMRRLRVAWKALKGKWQT